MIPAGWKLVPIEPTENMLVFGQEAITRQFVNRSVIEDCLHSTECYRNMLAVSPEPPSTDDAYALEFQAVLREAVDFVTGDLKLQCAPNESDRDCYNRCRREWLERARLALDRVPHTQEAACTTMTDPTPATSSAGQNSAPNSTLTPSKDGTGSPEAGIERYISAQSAETVGSTTYGPSHRASASAQNSLDGPVTEHIQEDK